MENGAKILDVLYGTETFLLELSIEYSLLGFTVIDKKKLFLLFLASIKPNNLNFNHADIFNETRWIHRSAADYV
ncbi:hypothetical protein RhiirA4_472387 [Rhizophagus irregularis]|uniref:Uncharacterized protein n=1 Tax=Rhizophagus irregularis TaxID=588596 RepID=A0A2I1H4V9_9GLOM|nr:hypothetical protein RhiirA4_472387 [Rhizophagus irregularis]